MRRPLAASIRGVDEGVELVLGNEHARGALRIESARVSRVRLALDGETLALARVMPALAGFAWVRAERGPLALIPPIRASDARSTGRDAWPRAMAERLAASSRTWLRPGRWALAPLERRARGELWPADGVPSIARKLHEALTLPRSFVEPYAPSGSGRVLALRDPSRPTDARVKSWRKHAREGALPPILLGWIGGLDAYVVLDGHDRLLAAQLEGELPDALALFGVRDDGLTWTDAERDAARADALARYARVFVNEPLLSDHSRIDAGRALAGAWSDYAGRWSWTPATYRADLAYRFAREIDALAPSEDAREVLMAP